MARKVYPPGYQGCYRCKQIKPLDEFYPSTPYTCKSCKRDHVKAWNAANREQHESNKLRGIRRNQAYLYSYLSDKRCGHCGCSDLLVLELHHLFGKQRRSHNVSSLVNGGASLQRVKDELAKCEVLCRNCHIVEECRLRYEQGQSDFRYAYQYHNETPTFPHTQQITKKRYLLDYFKAHPCIDCGATNVVFLQFDHVRDDKTANVGWLLNNRGFDDMVAEITKCDVVCANCHVYRTIQRAETFRYNYIKEKEAENLT